MTDLACMDQTSGENWTLINGDSSEVLPKLPDRSVDFMIASPPFSSTYTYSPSERDMGNVANDAQFWEQCGYVSRELLRIMRPGRLVALHVANLPAYENTHGASGRRDFRGDTIRHFESMGFIYHSERAIQKNPQALRHGQRVLTPSGWTPIESLAVGDAVIGRDGTATKVEGVWPQGKGQTYRVKFSDGATVECDAAHLWTVRNAADLRNDRWRTLRTDELTADGLKGPSGYVRYEIPLVAPVEYAPVDLPLHPYVLGALLGDGSTSARGSIMLGTQRLIARRVGNLLPDGCTIRELADSGKGDDYAAFLIGHPEWHRNDVLSALRELGVAGQRAWEKRVPPIYLLGSVQERRELLMGLLDTDGTVKLSGSAWFGTTSEGLAHDVAELARSLGGLAHIRCETGRRYVYNGKECNGRPAYLVCIELDGEPLVTLPHKVARWRRTRRRWTRRIVSIEPSAVAERTCITVAADDGLFVTEGHVVTHNSQAIRTHSKGLLFMQLNRDSAAMWQAWADYVVIMRAPGKNGKPIPGELSQEEWINDAHPIHRPESARRETGAGLSLPGQRDRSMALADETLPKPPVGARELWDEIRRSDLSFEEWWRFNSPVWTGIRETEVLGVHEARENQDERHLCPLQLPVIERCIRLWSGPGETVLSPWAGIGSEGVEAVRLGRKFVGVELKPSYYRVGIRNLQAQDTAGARVGLFDEEMSAS